jgi:hypothetical protein
LHALFDAVDARPAANHGPSGTTAASKSFGWLRARGLGEHQELVGHHAEREDLPVVETREVH